MPYGVTLVEAYTRVMNILGVIPARGGSKGIPKKNTRVLGGRPLIGWACLAGKRSQMLSRLVCSTDSPEIAEACRAHGVEAPFLRPYELASDEALVIDVLLHALRAMDPQGDKYHYVCLLQATSPFVTADLIDEAISLAIAQDADTVITGVKCGQEHPSTMFTMGQDKAVRWLLPDKMRMARRQDLPPVLIRRGSVYVFRASMLRDAHTLYGERTFAVETDEASAITIDTELDFKLAELLIAEKKVKI
jgi:CMP-N,N'-diacetyllegionaminic acid synthase